VYPPLARLLVSLLQGRQFVVLATLLLESAIGHGDVPFGNDAEQWMFTSGVLVIVAAHGGDEGLFAPDMTWHTGVTTHVNHSWCLLDGAILSGNHNSLSSYCTVLLCSVDQAPKAGRHTAVMKQHSRQAGLRDVEARRELRRAPTNCGRKGPGRLAPTYSLNHLLYGSWQS
jgi:hypothetical protein